MKDILIADFNVPDFTRCFKDYFREMGMTFEDWDNLFNEMNNEELDGYKNQGYIRYADNGSVIGFIQFIPIRMTNWFLNEKLGFIREFWISGEYRKMGHATDLLRLAEKYFTDMGIRKVILTSDTVQDFYVKNGYRKDLNVTALNKDDVFVKVL